MPQGPLSGITVIDLTRVLAGPFSTMLLSELGCLLYTSPSPRDLARSRMPSSA